MSLSRAYLRKTWSRKHQKRQQEQLRERKELVCHPETQNNNHQTLHHLISGRNPKKRHQLTVVVRMDF